MNKDRDVILVSGATGQQGGAVARQLIARGCKVRAMTRKPGEAKARALASLGAEVVDGDLNDAASLERALAGAWGAFSLQNTWEAGVEREEEQGKRFAEAAKKSGVSHLVYSSVASADRNTGIPHFENKFRIEQKVRSLGFPSWTIVRPVFFMDNLLSPWFKPGIDEGKLVMAIKPDTVLQMIAVEDIGWFGARAFEKHAEMNGKDVDIAGDARTLPQTAETLSRAAGRKIEFSRAPIEEVRKASEDYAKMLEWFDRVGYDADIPALEKEYAYRPTAFADWASKQRW
ncbi:MAG TPA: NmrA/HSCARG family protein [Thermoanaerobaculia bacterium]|nr:NmrA/HSCARG family protein [Thermoanaerobaculia bacterium]